MREVDSEQYIQLPHTKLPHLMDNALLPERQKFDKFTIFNDILSELFNDYLQNHQTIDFRIPSSSVISSIIDGIK